MNTRTYATIDGNEAVAKIVYQLNEVIAIYPITPSSPMAEWSDTWMSEGKPNIWGTVPSVVQLQSEGGGCWCCTWGFTNRFTDNNFYSFSGIDVNDSQYV